MKPEEIVIKQYLESLKPNSLVYEPDGNCPPDFLLNGEVAIEVRRLNQHFYSTREPEPLEQLSYQLQGILLGIADKYLPENYENQCFYKYEFSRPLVITKALKNLISNAFKTHSTRLTEDVLYPINENLQIQFFPSSVILDRVFQLGIISDHDSGGFISYLISKNLNFAIKEKEDKINKYRAKYSKWWLLLYDTIGYGIEPGTVNEIKKLLVKQHIFDKVILINPINLDSSILLER